MLFHPPVYFGKCINAAIYTEVPEEPEDVDHATCMLHFFMWALKLQYRNQYW